MTRLLGALARLRPVLGICALALLLLSLSRLGLAGWHHARVTAVDGWAPVLLQGLRVDIASVCLLFGPLAALLMLLPAGMFAWRAVRGVAVVWLVAGFTLLANLELATPGFMQEYGLRPNRLFIEYLVYPREVLSMLVGGRPLECIAVLVLTGLAAWGSARLVRRCWPPDDVPLPGLPVRAVLALLVLALAALGVRSTLGHRPMNPAMLAFSSDPTVNTLPLNSFYSLGDAVRGWLRHEDSAQALYGELPDAEVLATVRRDTGLPAAAFADPAIPTLAARTPTWQGRPKNLVIVLEESLGAQFIGSLGGRPLSPHYDTLSRQGWAFTHLYATGTRSVRGIEAVVAGFAPTPAQAVVKRQRSQHGFFTLAEVLRRRGYDTTFYYGGESHFDNMRGFFLGNGFGRVIEQRDYRNPTFVGAWGVSDEDLLARADSEFARLHAEGRPFFGFVFTSSNHDPFEFPEGRIAPYEQPLHTRDNAAKYADHALGGFFARAMASDYWRDTVFLVVADHDSRVFGRDLVPIDNFHIPGLILGGGIAPRRDDRIASQIDLGPTLLSLIGIGDATPMTGRDLSDPHISLPGRALMQYDRNFAWLQGEDVVVFQPDKPPSQYRYTPGTGVLRPTALSPALARQAHAQALWGSLAYDRGWYRLPSAR
ncbi:LTA synthase family protein [Luteimonas sp. RC10]|uniref:LTA synthase family protein n=1 Tax=Luteimonas sp. RC10 TaxID=2587035 RepID=UPI0016196134|nr:LTA synthase family protein [Luteimonas sp. RC10]MBB3344708.1 phosphoglycerol transferase MdoB-like AlkP superfamily enzyme [Luteimonas sp. RC10]